MFKAFKKKKDDSFVSELDHFHSIVKVEETKIRENLDAQLQANKEQHSEFTVVVDTLVNKLAYLSARMQIVESILASRADSKPVSLSDEHKLSGDMLLLESKLTLVDKLEISAEQLAKSNNTYDLEEGLYTWTGPDVANVIDLPIKRNKPKPLNISVISSVLPGLLNSMKLYVNEQPLPYKLKPQDHGTLVISKLPKDANCQNTQLKIVVDNTYIPNGLGTSSDERKLGLALKPYQCWLKFFTMADEIRFAPLASIIIPAYNNFELTQRAIESIRQSSNSASYEIVLIDDCSTDQVAEIEHIISDLVVVRNESNLQFLRSCNKAASMCTGQFFVFLNNDTEVRDRWLDELLLPFYDTENVGITGSMLITGDGLLQEAGGIVWASGKPANVGSGDNPKRPEYNYRRDVDYLSGASLCISRDVWEASRGI